MTLTSWEEYFQVSYAQNQQSLAEMNMSVMLSQKFAQKLDFKNIFLKNLYQQVHTIRMSREDFKKNQCQH